MLLGQVLNELNLHIGVLLLESLNRLIDSRLLLLRVGHVHGKRDGGHITIGVRGLLRFSVCRLLCRCVCGGGCVGGRVRRGCLCLGCAGCQCQQHGQCKDDCNNLFHGFLLDLHVIDCVFSDMTIDYHIRCYIV